LAKGQPHQYLRNASAQTVSRILSVGANLVSLVLVARILGTEIFGQYAFIMAYVNIASSLADLGTTSVLARDLAREKDARPELYFGNFLFLRGTITLLAALIAASVAFFVKPGLLWPLVLCSLAIPFVASRFFDPIFQVFSRPWYSVYTGLAYGLGLVAVSVILLVWLELSLFEYLLGWIGCNILYTLMAFWLARKIIRPRFSIRWTTIRSIAVLAAPLGVGALFSIINTRADVVMLSYMRSIYEVGIYGAAYKLLDFGSIVAITLLWPLVPILAQEQEKSPPAGAGTARRVMELAALLSFPVAAVAPFLAGPAIQIIYGDQFFESARVLGVFGLVFVILVFCLVGVIINLAAGNVRHAYWNTALAVAINISLNLWLIPRYGFVGAAYATLVSHVAMLLVQHYIVFRHHGSLFCPPFWVKVLALNIGLFAILYALDAGANVLLVPLALAIYVLLVVSLRLVPRDIFAALRSFVARRGSTGI